jgi:hypothetical protein
MFYFKAPGFHLRDRTTTNWGDFTWFVEVGDDQRAIRQVNAFDDGNILRYDRSHNWDDYGMLLGLKFSRKPKWSKFFPGAELISADDFEGVWRLAQSSPLWSLQLSTLRTGRNF